MYYIKGKGYFEAGGLKVGSKRKINIALAKIYGAKGDVSAFTRLRIESRVSQAVLLEAYRQGAASKFATQTEATA